MCYECCALLLKEREITQSVTDLSELGPCESLYYTSNSVRIHSVSNSNMPK